MWFRGVAASMGLCLDLGATLEGHPDDHRESAVLPAVSGDDYCLEGYHRIKSDKIFFQTNIRQKWEKLKRSKFAKVIGHPS